MQLAIKQARIALSSGEIPVGAVVVRGDEVIASAHNTRETENDPAGHAELVAMRTAAQKLDNWRLQDCTVYVTLEPCVMCAGAMVQARIRRCVVGALDPRAGALDSLYAINDDPRLNHNFIASFGVLEEECQALLDHFFSNLRASE